MVRDLCVCVCVKWNLVLSSFGPEEDGDDVSNRFLKKHNLLGVSGANKLTLRSYATEW